MAEEKSSPWKGRVEAGGVSSTGNSKLTSFNTALTIGYEKDDWLYNGRGEYYLTKSEDDQTEWAVASGSVDYKISERYYAMTALRYDENPDTGYDYRASESVGVGAYLFKRSTFTMKVEAGPGVRQSKAHRWRRHQRDDYPWLYETFMENFGDLLLDAKRTGNIWRRERQHRIWSPR